MNIIYVLVLVLVASVVANAVLLELLIGAQEELLRLKESQELSEEQAWQ